MIRAAAAGRVALAFALGLVGPLVADASTSRGTSFKPASFAAAPQLVAPSLAEELRAIEAKASKAADCAALCDIAASVEAHPFGVASAEPLNRSEDAWGNYRFTSELTTSHNRFGFTGHYWDKEASLYYAKARYYDPFTARFTQADSFLGKIDDPPSLHRYFYAHANPTMYVDLTGHETGQVALSSVNPEVAKRMQQQGELVGKRAAWALGSAARTMGELAQGLWSLTLFALDEETQQRAVAKVIEEAPGLLKKTPVLVEAFSGSYAAQAELLQPIVESRSAAYNAAVDEYALATDPFEQGWIATGPVQLEGGFIAAPIVGGFGRALRSLTAVDAAVGPATSAPVASDVFHIVSRERDVRGILSGIQKRFLNPDSRFGRAFYVGETPGVAANEVRFHGGSPSHALRFEFDAAKARVLDFTDPKVAKAWGYRGGPVTNATKEIGARALAEGYNVIRFNSVRGGGTNLAVLNDFNDLLVPKSVAPVPGSGGTK